MPDLTGLPALDLVLGLAFVYFVLSVAVSALVEIGAGVVALRAKTLERALGDLLAKQAAEPAPTEGADPTLAANKAALKAERTTAIAGLLREPHIAALLKQPRWGDKVRLPSYIPSRTLVLALPNLLHQLWKLDDGIVDALRGGRPSQDLLNNITNPTIRSWLEDAVLYVQETAGSAETVLKRFQTSLERSFDGFMDRVSGWYKRRSQIIVVVLSVALIAGINADSFTIGDRLWKDDAVRQAVAAQAQKVGTDAVKCNQELAKDKPLDAVGECVDQIPELGLPLGWEEWPSGWGWPAKILGLLITIAALSLGAPFWFDVLGKVAHLRNTGNREGTAKTGAAAEDRDDPSGKRPGS